LGIAAVQQASARLTRTGHMMGTPYYMSPEQAVGEQVDGRSDIYALGIVLYEMLSGSVPFTAESPLAVLHQQLYDPPPPLIERRAASSATLSAATYQLVEICLQKDPANRYQSAAHLYIALGQALQAESGTPLTEMLLTPTGERAIIPTSRRPRPVWLPYAGGAVVVVIILTAVFLWPKGENGEEEQSPPAISQRTAAPTETIVATLISTAVILPSSTPLPMPTTPPPAEIAVPTAVPTTVPTAVPTAVPVLPTIVPIIAANVNAPYFNLRVIPKSVKSVLCLQNPCRVLVYITNHNYEITVETSTLELP
jgi:serine/threonine-protein kinase